MINKISKTQLEKLAQKLTEIANQYHIDMDIENLEVTNKYVSVIIDEETAAPVTVKLFDYSASKLNLIEIIGFELMIHDESMYTDDESVQDLLNSKLKYDPDKEVVYNYFIDVQNEVKDHQQTAYKLTQCISMTKYPLKLHQKSTDKYTKLLTTLFRRWCQKAWINGYSEKNLEYPERASLSYNAVEHFANDLWFLENIEFDEQDIYDLQTKIMQGMGTYDQPHPKKPPFKVVHDKD